MTYTFKSITEARSHLMESGFSFAGYTKLVKGGEFYKAGNVGAIIKRAAFGKVTVNIRAA